MHHEHQLNAGPEPSSIRHVEDQEVATGEILEHWAIEALQVAAVRFHDFFREGHPHMSQELECFLIESGSAQGAEELLTELVDALTVLGDMRQNEGFA